MSHSGSARRRGLILLFAALVLSSSAGYPQPAPPNRLSLFLDGGNLSAEQKTAHTQHVLTSLRQKAAALQQLKNLQGDVVARAACPIGYVDDVSYRFSTSEILVVATEKLDCDSANQCRAWEIEASPLNQQTPYDLTIQLQCSNADTLPRRSRAELETLHANQPNPVTKTGPQ